MCLQVFTIHGVHTHTVLFLFKEWCTFLKIRSHPRRTLWFNVKLQLPRPWREICFAARWNTYFKPTTCDLHKCLHTQAHIKEWCMQRKTVQYWLQGEGQHRYRLTCYFLCVLSAVAACSALKETQCDKWSASVPVMEGRWGGEVVLPWSPPILLGCIISTYRLKSEYHHDPPGGGSQPLIYLLNH